MRGANVECDGLVWRIDVGMSSGVLDAPVAVLEINQVRADLGAPSCSLTVFSVCVPLLLCSILQCGATFIITSLLTLYSQACARNGTPQQDKDAADGEVQCRIVTQGDQLGSYDEPALVDF